jgi:RNA polymerase sigma-70 factor (ECF subfamily)
MFPETRWTLIAAATLNGEGGGRAALEVLCRSYWPAVVAFLMGRGFSPHDAEDLAQDFFAALTESRLWQRADQSRGRFRTFLLGALMRVVGHHQRHQQALKRGGGVVPLDLDQLPELAAPEVEEQLLFDRAWAEQILENALTELESEWPQPAEFLVLQRFLPVGDDPPAYEAASRELDCGVGAFKSRVLRFRMRFRELIEAQVARTVATPHDMTDELRYLERILADPGYETSPVGSPEMK